MISKTIKAIRMKLALTQAQLAESIKTTPSMICHYEAGRIRPTIRTVRRIVDFAREKGLSITYEDLLNDEQDSKD